MAATAIGLATALPLAKAADEGPESLITTPIQALEDNNPRLLWDMLPASYQKDLNGLVQSFAKEMDAELWDAAFDLAGSVGELLRTKKDLVAESMTAVEGLGLSMPKGPNGEELPMEDLIKGMELVGTMLEKVAKSDLGSLAKLKTADLGTIAETLGSEIMTLIDESEDSRVDTWGVETLRGIEVEVVSEEGDNATIKVSDLPEMKEYLSNTTFRGADSSALNNLLDDLQDSGENPFSNLSELENGELEVVKVEGKWIPKELADGWKEGMDAARLGLQGGLEIPPAEKQQALAMINGIRNGLNAVKKAKTPEQFQLAIMQATMGAMMGAASGPDGGVSAAQKAEARQLAEGEISLTNGDIIEGTVADVDQNGIVVRRDIGGFARRANWMELTQESLKKIKNLGETDPNRYKGATAFAEPFIEPDESQMERNLPPGPVRGLVEPEVPSSVPVASKMAAYGSGGGIGLLVAIAIGSMVAGLGVAAFRESNALLAAGVSLILPIVGPILFLVKPKVEYEDDYDEDEEYEYEEAEAPEGATMTDTGGGAVVGMVPEANKMSFAQTGPKKSGLKPQTWTRGDTRFDRSFFQNNFPNYFKVVLGAAERDMALAVKTGKREYVGQRIKRISGTDVHMELLNGKEQKITFSEIGAVDLRAK